MPFFVLSLFQTWQNTLTASSLKGGTLTNLFASPVFLTFVVLLSIAGLILGIWFSAASLESVIRVVNSEPLLFKDTYKTAWGYILRLFLAGALVGLIVVGGLILIIIPGVIFAVWFAFTQFGVARNSLGVMDSLRQSKEIVKGRFWKVFGRFLVFMVFIFVVQIVFSLIPYIGAPVLSLFGALFVLPYYLLYRELKG